MNTTATTSAAASTHAAAIHTDAVHAKMNVLTELSTNVVYLMGTSFVLGSLFTIFVLLLLDFMQRDRMSK